MTKAVVTHFDGDPFLLNFWLTLYIKYWRGECDRVYLSIYYNRHICPKEVVDFNTRLLAQFPEIVVDMRDEWDIPERANMTTLAKVTEDLVGLIESDGFIYSSGIVAQCFRLLEEGQDLVAPPYKLIEDPYIKGDLHTQGYMRCFLFTKMALLRKTDVDFFPRTIPKGTQLSEEYTTEIDQPLDCFGWLSWQLALLHPKTTYTENMNLNPDNILSPYTNFKWVHVRQMQSSSLGMGGGDYKLWEKGEQHNIVENIFKVFNEEFPGGPAEFTLIKSVAFRLLFWDILNTRQILGQFADDYRQILEAVMDLYDLPRQKIYEVKGFYKGLFNI